ncbi:MAG: aldo/keto reductase [Candidatus Altiarchaeota archaeon]|nr:aldo/keto reductase [Candidatus Altiarchaeota archaeon]
MEYVSVRGVKVPAIGFGTWEIVGEECRKSVASALELGYRHIDTAQIYMNEDKVGRAIAESGVKRDEIFLTTKLWLSNLAGSGVIKSFNESLRNLKTGYVDLLLIHWPYEKIPYSETLGAMNQLVKDGKVRHIGVSNFTLKQLEKARQSTEEPIICNQVEYHPFLSQNILLDYCQKNDIMLTAYSPLGRGNVKDDETLAKIGKKYCKTPAQISLRWLTQQKNVAAVPKSKSKKHQKENLEILDFKLTQDEMQEIAKLARGERLINPPFAPKWD